MIMNFPDTVTGDLIPAESAARYNAVNALLRTGAVPTVTPSAAAVKTGLTVDICNVSDAPVGTFCAVAFTGTVRRQSSGIAQLPGFEVIPAANCDLPWGIATSAITPGAWGTAVISGATPAYFARKSSGEPYRLDAGIKVVPTAAGLFPRGDCGATVLGAEQQRDDGTIAPGVIMLDGIITMPYTGDFAVSCLDPEQKRYVIAAGKTGFPGLELLPATEISFPGVPSSGSIRLVISYTRDDDFKPVYTPEFCLTSSFDKSDCFMFELAKIAANGALTQVWKQGKITVPGWIL